GSRGTTLLREEAGGSWSGEAAEEELARLLGAGTQGRATEKQIQRQWSHLWVFQGTSFKDPSEDAAQEAERLIQSLQEKGGAVVQQSANDRRVRRELDERFEKHFKAAGGAKAHSPAELARQRRDEARASVSAAEDAVGKLDNALTDADTATKALEEIRSSLTTARSDISKAEAQSREVTELELRKATLEPKLAEASALLARLSEADGRIRGARRRIAELDQQVEPLRERAREAEERLRLAELTEKSAELEADRARQILEAARIRQDIASALVSLRRGEAEGGHLAEQASRAQAKVDEAAALQTKLAALPAIDEDDVGRLRELRESLLKAEVKQDAMAAEVEVLSAGLAVQIAGEDVAAGDSCKVSEVTDVQVGPDTLLRIRPGGGNQLAKVRREVGEMRAELDGALRPLGVRSFEEAMSVARDVDALRGTLKSLEAELAVLAPEAVRRRQQELAEEMERQKGDIDRWQQLLEAPLDLPGTEEDAAALRRDLEAALARDSSHESGAQARRRDARVEYQSADVAQRKTAENVETATKERTEVSVLLDRDLAEYGQDELRAVKLSEAERAEEETRRSLDAVETRLRELGPDEIENRKARLESALKKLVDREQDESVKLRNAEFILHGDRASDPREALADARAELLLAERECAARQRDADAVKLLRSLFQEEEAALTDLFTGPLAERMTAYLRPVFPGARAEVLWGEKGMEGLKLVRGQAETFDVLSGGTKEQVAAAARLAIAEVLAESFGGSLPVVFDESFAHSDPDRTLALQDMLYRAGERGLQVIV
ncbi:MAG TPA: hypothetical protein VLH81_12110, partial [Desulfobacterales bacterium]|nr:hypothetical protein [Desulfobacterales bacterium]